MLPQGSPGSGRWPGAPGMLKTPPAAKERAVNLLPDVQCSAPSAESKETKSKAEKKEKE